MYHEKIFFTTLRMQEEVLIVNWSSIYLLRICHIYIGKTSFKLLTIIIPEDIIQSLFIIQTYK